MSTYKISKSKLVRYTPEPIKNWADFMDIEESQENKIPDFDKKQRYIHIFVLLLIIVR